jgi:hypothetical protein
MGEVIRFETKRARARLIREARRSIYDSIFPQADPVSEQQDKAPLGHIAHAYHSGGDVLS